VGETNVVTGCVSATVLGSFPDMGATPAKRLASTADWDDDVGVELRYVCIGVNATALVVASVSSPLLITGFFFPRADYRCVFSNHDGNSQREDATYLFIDGPCITPRWGHHAPDHLQERMMEQTIDS